MKDYSHECEICDVKGEGLVETHHIVPKFMGGLDVQQNTVRLCPNCHRKTHKGLIKINGWLDLKYKQILEWEEVDSKNALPLYKHNEKYILETLSNELKRLIK